MSCDKRPYSKKLAQTVVNRRNKGQRGRKNHRLKKQLRIYHCSKCNWWHLTHKDLYE